MAAQFAEDMPYFYECVKKGFQEVDESVDNAKMMGNFTPHQAESATKGRNHAVTSLLQLTGKDKEYNVKADVNADIEAKTENTTTIQTEFQKAYQDLIDTTKQQALHLQEDKP